MAATIAQVEPGSLAEQAGLRAGDIIEEINGIEIHDYLDYMFASCQEQVDIRLKNRRVQLENEDYMPLGIVFPTMLIDEPKSCHNKCVFCFIDQLPRGMRQSCYFKDDDYRLSFLQGNYVSMTNMTEEDVERIIRYHIPRINISVHTTNPELRCRMLHNKNAGKVLDYLKKFARGGLFMNAQIVLCPGYNDKAELDRTISDLSDLGDCMESVSVVPVGLSAHRKGLAEMTAFDKNSAAQVIRQVEAWQEKLLEQLGTRLIYLSDEFYLMAEQPLPKAEAYEGFPQIENGVGLCASLIREFEDALENTKRHSPKRQKTIATGYSALPVLQGLARRLEGKRIRVIPIRNDFFGHGITVSGLITGGDLIAQLKDTDLGEELLISSSMLRHDRDLFLDDTTIPQVEEALGVSVRVVDNDGYALLEALLD